MPLYEHVFLARQDASTQQVEELTTQMTGIVEGLGQKVTAFQPRDEVQGTADDVFADYVCVHSGSIRLADND